MRYSKFIIITLMLFSSDVTAQDITGLWKGTLFNDTTRQYNRYEIAISEEKGKLTGFSHTWFLDGDKQYFGVKKVKVKRLDDKVIVEDDELLANNYPIAPAKNVRQLNVLTLHINDTSEILSGPFSTNQTKVYSVLTGSINIRRAEDYWQSSLVPHLQELGLAKRLSFVNDDLAVLHIVAIAQPAKPGITEVVAPPAPIMQEEVALNPVIVDAKTFEKPTAPVIKEQRPTKAPVAVNKKLVPQKEETVKSDATATKISPVKTQTPVKEEASNAKKNVGVTKEVVVAKTDVAVEKAVAANKPVAKAEVIVPKPQVLPPLSATAALDVKRRATELQQTLYFTSDSLQLSLFDNGEVDGDTVSVLMNGVIIFAKERLSTNAVRKMVAIDPSQDSVQLIMYAENLGTIPPNTGLLVVKDGKDIYEVRFNGNLQKNAAIVFRRRKP